MRSSKTASKRKHSKRKKKKIKLTPKTVILLAVGIVILIFAIWMISVSIEAGSLPDAKGDTKGYAVHGIDVSSYQGNIDWPKLANQGISFAFIKATEGSSHVDSYFTKNWKGAHATNLKVGAYHFMSFETSGKLQAENFIRTVEKKHGALPPVVDVEYYGKYLSYRPSKDQLQKILTPLLNDLKSHYGKKPIIYTTPAIYKNYIAGDYNNPIWISDTTLQKSLPDGNKWTFCQYSFSGILPGYSGAVKHIDLDVFYGSKFDFAVKY